MVYWYGNEFTDITGGWIPLIGSSSSASYRNASVNKNSLYVESTLRGAGSDYLSGWQTSNYVIRNITKFYIRGQGTKTGNASHNYGTGSLSYQTQRTTYQYPDNKYKLVQTSNRGVTLSVNVDSLQTYTYNLTSNNADLSYVTNFYFGTFSGYMYVYAMYTD